MLVDPSNSSANAGVAGAIRQASQSTGASFNYLLATAQVESGLNPNAGASTSSARGLFQFIEQTWLATIKQSGSALGYGRYADAISQTASGRYEVSDPALRREILKLRSDPTANAVMAGAFTKSNADILSQRLGRAPSEGELYIAHFLGVGGAARLISLAASNPNCARLALFLACRAGQFLDFLRSQRSAAQCRAGARRADRALRRGARQPGPLDARWRRLRLLQRRRPRQRRHRRRIPPALPVRSPPVSNSRPTAAALPKHSRRSRPRRQSPIGRISRCSKACSPMPTAPRRSHRS